ncbi:MAG: hypothetical protein U0793_04225 [Gemmataceae bacterium]
MDDNFRSDIGYGPGATEAFPAESGPSRVDPWAGVVPGLASLGIAMTFIIGAPGTMHVIWELYFHRFHGFSPVQVALVAICGFLGFLMIGTALVFGFVFGVGAILARGTIAPRGWRGGRLFSMVLPCCSGSSSPSFGCLPSLRRADRNGSRQAGSGA